MKIIPSGGPEKIFPDSSIFIFFFLLIFASLCHAKEDQHDICAGYQQDEHEYNRDDKTTANTAFSKGLLWRVTGIKGQVNYLFGAMHSQDHRVTRISPAVRLAIVKSDVLVLETIPDQTAEDTFMAAIYANNHYSLRNLIDINVYERIENEITDYGIPAERLDQLKPWAVFSIMGRPKPVHALSLESALKNIAQAANRQVAGLESMEEIVAALDGLKINDQIEILNDTICNHKKIIRDTATLVQLYLDRDLDGIWKFNNQPHRDEEVFNRFMEKLVYERNIRLLDRMKKYLDNGRAFIAVGAMHLAGEKGLLNSLQAEGYQLDRIY